MLLSGNPTVYTVNLTTDTGPTSAGNGSGDTGDLRDVINQAIADPNLAGSMIEFDPTVFGTRRRSLFPRPWARCALPTLPARC